MLSQFDNRDVLSATVAITGAGDGLLKALAVEPTEFHHGDRVFVVLEGEVTKVGFSPIKDTDALQRVHTIKAATVTMVDESLVRDVLDQQEIALERAQGIVRLPGMAGEDPDAADDPGDGDPPEAYTEDADGYAEPAPTP
jgi:hypothetical protein